MTSFLPGLLFLAPVSATLIRVTVAIILGYAGYRHFPHRTYVTAILGAVEAATAIALILGGSTQIAALVTLFIAATQLSQSSLRVITVSTLLIMSVLSISLVMTGAGAFAVDMAL